MLTLLILNDRWFSGYNNPMEYKYLGRTGIKVSELCLGTMSFGGISDYETSKDMYRTGRDAGINFFDCANVYQKGLAEEYLGDFIAGERHDLVIATKAYFPMSEKPNDRGSSRKNLTLSLHESLKRLKTDYIDIFFLHRFDDNTPLEESLRTLDDFVKQGKVLYIGLSNFAAWQAEKAAGISERLNLTPVHAVQPMYNLVKRQAEVEILPMAVSEGLGVMTYSPLAAGLLTGKYGKNRRPDKGRIVDNPMYTLRYSGDFYFEAAEKFTAYAKQLGVKPASLAVAWVASNPAVTTPIVSGRNSEQLKDSLESVDITVTGDMKKELDVISPPMPPATDRTEERTSYNYDAILTKK